MSQFDIQWNELARKIINTGWDEDPTRVRAVYEDTKEAAPTRFIIDHSFKFDGPNAPLQFGKKINPLKPIQELYWIMIMKSNKLSDLHDMDVHFWDNWEFENTGTIGKAYGYQIGLNCYPVKASTVDRSLLDPNKKYVVDNGYIMLDQIDHAIHQLRNNPQLRSIFLTLVTVMDLPKMGIRPCVWNTEIHVDGDMRVNFKVNARSSDVCLGNPFNVFQYHWLHELMSQVVDLERGFLKFDMGNAHIYDRHIEGAKKILTREDIVKDKECQLILPPSVKSLYDIKPEDFKLEGYEPEPGVKFTIAE